MGFGNAALLGGMVLGLLPIIIHLINKRRAKLVRFSAIDFLLLSDKKLARRLKIKQILVLALRVLLIVALAIALAKPYLEPDRVASFDISEPGAIALIIDDSASMTALDDDGRTRLAQRLDAARRLVDDRGHRTSMAVIASGAPARLLTEGVTFDGEALEAAIAQLTPSARGQDLAGALREAGRVLSESGEARRQILLLSDDTRHMWEDAPSTWTWAPATDVVPLSVAEPAWLPNLAVTRVEPDDADGGEDAFVIHAEIANYGPDTATVPVTLSLGSITAVEEVEIGSGRKETVTFRGATEPDRPQGLVRIPEATADSGANRLALDDTFYFTTTERRSLRVLIVNGAPNATSYLDEVFFLRPALAATPRGQPPLNLAVISPAGISSAQVASADVIILANVGTLTREQALALTHFVEGGGGLLITAGDRLDPRTVNAAYGALLPFPIREVKTVGRAGDPQSVLEALNIAAVDLDHPALGIFRGLKESSLFKARVRSYALVDTEGNPEARVIASLSGGIPLLIEAPMGRGRVMLWTSSIDRDWTDLVLRTSFPPLIQRIVAHLGRLLEGGDSEAERRGLIVGQSGRLPVPDGLGPVVVRRPDGTSIRIDEADEGEGEASVFIEAIDQPGHWETAREGEPGRVRVVAANVDRRESDLSLAEERTVASVRDLLTRDNGILPSFEPAGDTLSEAGLPAESARTVLWPWILAGLFLLFGGEAWLIIRS